MTLYPLLIVGEAPTMPYSSPSKPVAMDGVFFGDLDKLNKTGSGRLIAQESEGFGLLSTARDRDRSLHSVSAEAVVTRRLDIIRGERPLDGGVCLRKRLQPRHRLNLILNSSAFTRRRISTRIGYDLTRSYYVYNITTVI